MDIHGYKPTEQTGITNKTFEVRIIQGIIIQEHP